MVSGEKYSTIGLHSIALSVCISAVMSTVCVGHEMRRQSKREIPGRRPCLFCIGQANANMFPLNLIQLSSSFQLELVYTQGTQNNIVFYTTVREYRRE